MAFWIQILDEAHHKQSEPKFNTIYSIYSTLRNVKSHIFILFVFPSRRAARTQPTISSFSTQSHYLVEEILYHKMR